VQGLSSEERAEWNQDATRFLDGIHALEHLQTGGAEEGHLLSLSKTHFHEGVRYPVDPRVQLTVSRPPLPVHDGKRIGVTIRETAEMAE